MRFVNWFTIKISAMNAFGALLLSGSVKTNSVYRALF